MGDPPAPNKELEDLIKKFNDRKLLWTHVDEFSKLQDRWTASSPVRDLDSEDIQRDVQQYQQTVNKLKLSRGTLGK